jgi:hypothetical protein
MSKITEVKYLRVSLGKLPSDDDLLTRFPAQPYGRWPSNEVKQKLVLNDAYAEMETKVNIHLKLGWVLHGSVVWNYTKKHSNLAHVSHGADELLQTMVKYEMPKSTTVNLLRLLDEKSCKD